MNEVVNIKELNAHIEQESVFVDTLRKEISRVIVGQQHLIDTLLIGLLSDGHILLEGVPGLAKTLAITTLSKAVDAKFARIQFTPDLLPADLSVRSSTRSVTRSSPSSAALSSRTSSSPMGSTARPQRYSRHSSRRCRRSR